MGNEQGTVLNREPLKSPCEVKWNKGLDVQIQGKEGHSSVALNNKIYCYGGLGLDERLFGLAVFDTEKNTLREIQVTGEKPGPLCNASLNCVGTKLYLFGGLNRETGWNNDMWSFDTVTEKWEKLAITGIKPSPRDKHTSVIWEGRIVIFGGFGPATGVEDSEDDDDQSANFTWYNDVFLFDPKNNSWDAPNVSMIGGPVPRAAHSANIYKNKMTIFGGKDSKARNQDLFTLDLSTLEWSYFEDAGARPAPTSFHSSAQFGQFMLTYGGRFNDNSHSDQLNVLDCETGGWYSPVVEAMPSPRGQSTLLVLGDGTLVMFGGSNKFDMIQQCCQEFDTGVYRLDCNLLKCVEIPPPVVEETEDIVSDPSAVGDCNMADDSNETPSDKLAGV